MSTTRRQDSDSYQRSSAVARELRETVADQLHDLIIERDSLGSHREFVEGVQLVGGVLRELAQARGQQKQARELGLPLAPSVARERAAIDTLRQVVMSASAAGAAWCTAMDVDAQRASLEVEQTLNGRRRRRADEGENI